MDALPVTHSELKGSPRENLGRDLSRQIPSQVEASLVHSMEKLTSGARKRGSEDFEIKHSKVE